MLVNAYKKKFPDKKTYMLELTAYTATLIYAASYLLAICMGNTITCGLKIAVFSWSYDVIIPLLTKSMIILSEPY